MIVPERWSTTTRALVAVCTSMFSMLAISRAGVSMPLPARSSRTVPASSIVATRAPRSRLMAAAIRAAVVKSGLRSARRRSRIWVKSKATSRSTRAPEGMSPLVGTPWVTVSASPEATMPPAMIEPCATA